MRNLKQIYFPLYYAIFKKKKKKKKKKNVQKTNIFYFF